MDAYEAVYTRNIFAYLMFWMRRYAGQLDAPGMPDNTPLSIYAKYLEANKRPDEATAFGKLAGQKLMGWDMREQKRAILTADQPFRSIPIIDFTFADSAGEHTIVQAKPVADTDYIALTVKPKEPPKKLYFPQRVTGL